MLSTLSSSPRRLLLRGAGGGIVRLGKNIWSRRWRSWSRSSFSCFVRVLSATSRPPLQRTGHVHQAIRDPYGVVDDKGGENIKRMSPQEVSPTKLKFIGRNRSTSASLSFISLPQSPSPNITGLFVGGFSLPSDRLLRPSVGALFCSDLTVVPGSGRSLT